MIRYFKCELCEKFFRRDDAEVPRDHDLELCSVCADVFAKWYDKAVKDPVKLKAIEKRTKELEGNDVL
jgi:hypothetical protein